MFSLSKKKSTSFIEVFLKKKKKKKLQKIGIELILSSKIAIQPSFLHTGLSFIGLTPYVQAHHKRIND